MNNKDYKRLVLKKCVSCGKNNLTERSAWHCPDCLTKIAERERGRRRANAEEYREYKRQYMKKRKEAGICVNCKNKARTGMVMCQACADRYNENRRKGREHESTRTD